MKLNNKEKTTLVISGVVIGLLCLGANVKSIAENDEKYEAVTIATETTASPLTEAVLSYYYLGEDLPTEPETATQTELENNESQKIEYDEELVEALTNTLYGEANCIKADYKKAAVVWCILNRFDCGEFGDSIIEIATDRHQFNGYNKNRTYSGDEVEAYNHCKELVIDVLDRYYTDEQIGRTLPKNYYFFRAINGDNKFTKTFMSNDFWDWSLDNPYK